jgi:crossover junction endodeoxyribonuclease RuvC
MRIIGIDPGSRIMGYGIIEKSGSRLLHIDNGCLVAKATLSLPERLEQIYQGLLKIFEAFSPEVVAIEEVFFSKNVASSLRLGESRGIALLAAVQQKLPIFEYSTREVKQGITGYGQASKDQMQKMVQRLLNLPEIAQVDASDALAIAIYHAHSVPLRKAIG